MLHFWAIAPVAFPRFGQSRNLGTAVDHVISGVVMAVCHVQLVRCFRERPHLG